MEGLRDLQTQAAQSGIAGGDGQHDDTHQGDQAAHGAQDVLADHADGAGSQRGIGLLQAQVVHAHSSSGPNHSDEAFQNHHVVEGHPALTLALHGAGDDGRLGGMEAGQHAAGHGDEEDGDEVVGVEVLAIAEGGHSAVSGGELEHGGLPVIPHVQQGIALDKQADEHAQSREQQDRAEDRIDPANDLVDGEQGGDQVVDKDDTVDDPGGGGSGLAVKAEDLRSSDVAGGVDEHGAHQQQKQGAEHLVNTIDALVGILADHGSHLAAAVTQADHAGEIVVHGAADDVGDGDGNERDGPEQNALDGSKDGAGTCDVEQVDQGVLPASHGNVVHAVLLGKGGSFPVVGAKDLLAELAVHCGAHEQDHKADNECCHTHTLLFWSKQDQILIIR